MEVGGKKDPTKKEEFFVGDAVVQNELNSIERLPLVHWFVYEDLENNHFIALGDSTSKRVTSVEVQDEFTVFHFWAEPAFRQHEDHPLAAFDGLRNLLPGLDLGLNKNALHFPKDDKCETPPEIEGQDQNLFERCRPAGTPQCPDPLDHAHVGNCLSIYVSS